MCITLKWNFLCTPETDYSNNPVFQIRFATLCNFTKQRLRYKLGDFSTETSGRPIRVRIQKPVVTYDSRKSSVTSCAGLPNYFKINL
jgi:hypothetical protein